MANKRHGGGSNLTVEILKQIRAELTGLLELSGGRYRDHERRIRARERHVTPRLGT